jgi:aspartyl-tRNA(Asn)/glutamyl-tRNA(Gln) amidotransferase subunit C
MASPKVDRALVQHVAKLSSLSIGESEADKLAVELAKIVQYVAQLEELDVAEVPPTAHVQIERMPLRADEPRPCLSREEALAGAPRVENDGFAVTSFVEEK